jgi:hypothetical protein
MCYFCVEQTCDPCEDFSVDESEECDEAPIEGSPHDRDVQTDHCVNCKRELRP